jgi:hypothetical protein
MAVSLSSRARSTAVHAGWQAMGSPAQVEQQGCEALPHSILPEQVQPAADSAGSLLCFRTGGTLLRGSVGAAFMCAGQGSQGGFCSSRDSPLSDFLTVERGEQ